MSLYTIKLEEAKLHISKGNSKIGKGIWSFSTLPGNSEHLIYINGKILLTDTISAPAAVIFSNWFLPAAISSPESEMMTTRRRSPI